MYIVSARARPGRLLAAVTPRGALTVAGMNAERVEWLWGALRSGASFDQMVEGLGYGAPPPQGMPEFALLLCEDDCVRAALRGRFRLRDVAGNMIAAGANAPTWNEMRLTSVHEIVVDAGPGPGDQYAEGLPLGDGMLGLSSIRISCLPGRPEPLPRAAQDAGALASQAESAPVGSAPAAGSLAGVAVGDASIADPIRRAAAHSDSPGPQTHGRPGSGEGRAAAADAPVGDAAYAHAPAAQERRSHRELPLPAGILPPAGALPHSDAARSDREPAGPTGNREGASAPEGPQPEAHEPAARPEAREPVETGPAPQAQESASDAVDRQEPSQPDGDGRAAEDDDPADDLELTRQPYDDSFLDAVNVPRLEKVDTGSTAADSDFFIDSVPSSLRVSHAADLPAEQEASRDGSSHSEPREDGDPQDREDGAQGREGDPRGDEEASRERGKREDGSSPEASGSAPAPSASGKGPEASQHPSPEPVQASSPRSEPPAPAEPAEQAPEEPEEREDAADERKPLAADGPASPPANDPAVAESPATAESPASGGPASAESPGTGAASGEGRPFTVQGVSSKWPVVEDEPELVAGYVSADGDAPGALPDSSGSGGADGSGPSDRDGDSGADSPAEAAGGRRSRSGPRFPMSNDDGSEIVWPSGDSTDSEASQQGEAPESEDSSEPETGSRAGQDGEELAADADAEEPARPAADRRSVDEPASRTPAESGGPAETSPQARRARPEAGQPASVGSSPAEAGARDSAPSPGDAPSSGASAAPAGGFSAGVPLWGGGNRVLTAQEPGQGGAHDIPTAVDLPAITGPIGLDEPASGEPEESDPSASSDPLARPGAGGPSGSSSSAASSSPSPVEPAEAMTAAFEPDDLLPAEPSPESPSEASPLPSGEPWAEGALESGFDEGAEEDALADEGDHDGETVISSRAQELREQISGESEEESPAMVLALLCHYGHINPPHGSSCRLCGAPIGGEPNWYPRPALGEIYVSTGLRVPIDADIIIGRKPTSTPESGRPHAHLVPVPSPDQQISRTHCEVRVDGWDVRLVDRNSNNGTYVLRPGERPIRIRPTEPFFVRVGDVIDIGEGVTIQMLGPQAGV